MDESHDYLNAGGVVTFEHDWLDVRALPR